MMQQGAERSANAGGKARDRTIRGRGPARAGPADLADIPALPDLFRRLAQHQLRDPRTTSDHLLLMADGLAEASEAAALDGFPALREALRTLTSVLRGLAPAYAGNRRAAP